MKCADAGAGVPAAVRHFLKVLRGQREMRFILYLCIGHAGEDYAVCSQAAHAFIGHNISVHRGGWVDVAASRAILSEQAQLPEGDARRLDAFTLSLVRVMGDAELQSAIAAGDKEGIVGRLLALRGEVKLDAATREQLQRIAAEYGVEVGEGSDFAELVPSAFFIAISVLAVVVVALAFAAVSYAGLATAVGLAASEAWVLGTEDKLIPTA